MGGIPSVSGMKLKLLNAGCLAALIATSCSVSAQTLRERPEGMLRAMYPLAAARWDFQRAGLDYRRCLSSHPNDIRACKGQRAIWDATGRAYSALARPRTTVYLPPRW